MIEIDDNNILEERGERWREREMTERSILFQCLNSICCDSFVSNGFINSKYHDFQSFHAWVFVSISHEKRYFCLFLIFVRFISVDKVWNRSQTKMCNRIPKAQNTNTQINNLKKGWKIELNYVREKRKEKKINLFQFSIIFLSVIKSNNIFS